MATFIIFGAKYLFLIVLAVAIGAFWTNRDQLRKSYIVTALIATVIAIVLTKLAGAIYFDPRPFTHGVIALIAHGPDNGFPSDHVVLSATAAAVTFRFTRIYGIPLLLLAALVGMCRVAAGVHSPVDAIAGMIIGIVAAWSGVFISTRWELRNEAWSSNERK